MSCFESFMLLHTLTRPCLIRSSGFVSPSAGFNFPSIHLNSICPSCKASRTKKYLLSTHFTDELYPFLLATSIAFALSQYTGTGPGCSNPRATVSFLSQIASFVAVDNVQNSAVVLLVATRPCFLVAQLIGAPANVAT